MDQHKKWVSQVFDCAANQYGEKSCSFFNHFGKQLVEQVPVGMNQRVLDIATGRGAILFPLAEKVGPSGSVVGIDISEQMINETAAAVKTQNISWIHLMQMDAEDLHFPENSFDVVFCGFALFFFPALSKALAEFKRVLKPNGFLAVSTWGDDSELDALVNREIDRLSNTKSLAVHPLWTSEALQTTLEQAHFKSIQIKQETKKFLHSTSEDWWDSLWAHGTRSKLEQLSAQQLAGLRENVIHATQALDKGNGLTEDLQVIYGIAKK